MTSPISVQTKRSGFTLLEMLIVIGILAMLFAILLPVVSRALRSAQRARMAADLQTISVGLEAYKADNDDQLPRAANPGSVGGSQLLVEALISPGDAAADGADGAGYRSRKGGVLQGKVKGPYLHPEKWKHSLTELQDGNGKAILYVPARPVRPNINTAGLYLGINDNALYDVRYIDAGKFNVPASFAYLMGDLNGSGDIGPGETPATTAPFLLWAAGPDGSYGLQKPDFTPADAAKCDDVTNFK